MFAWRDQGKEKGQEREKETDKDKEMNKEKERGRKDGREKEKDKESDKEREKEKEKEEGVRLKRVTLSKPTTAGIGQMSGKARRPIQAFQGQMLTTVGIPAINPLENRQGRPNVPMTPEKSLTVLGKKVIPSPAKPHPAEPWGKA